MEKMSKAGQNSILQLREAEAQAGDIVARARAERVARMKAAKAEAQAEIDAYRGEREAEFGKLQSSVLGANDAGADALEKATAQELSALRAQCDANRGAVVDLLVSAATNVRPSVPEARKCPVKIG